MNFIYFNCSKIRPMRWLLATLICVLLVVWSPLPAVASVTQIEEYPGQMLYQSRQKLQDQNGNFWQVIAFKRIHPEGNAIVSLRLVGFPGAVEFDRTQPLTLTTSMGKTLTAKDISSEIYQDTPTPANVGEYDIKSVLPQLQAEIPLHLTLPMVTGSAIELQIPSVAIQEWQAVSAR
ncbi:DUF3122 domain-containing protein [Argonema antarcticum A004/B2]|nr:DUF3122 domain-containing protein [Argonema antarcticum A004/B2]